MKVIIMKRLTLFFVIAAVLTLSFSTAITASAYTQDDLLEEFKTIPAAHWVLADIEQLSENMKLTQEQCDALWPILQEVKALVPEDNGPTVYMGSNHGNQGRAYSAEVVAQVLDCIRAACKITGCTFVKSLVPEQTHEIDIVFKLYNSDGVLIFEYDGDLVKKTDSAESATVSASEDGNAYGYLFAGIGALALAGGAAVIIGKRSRCVPAAA